MVLRGRTDTRPPVDAATACHADRVSKVYGARATAVHALRDVTLDIPRSAFTAVMGPSGSGKSTLLHCLAALDTPTSGRVFLGGTELTALSRRQQARVRRDRIGFVFQSFNLVPTLSALENITLPQLLAGRRPDRAWLDHVIGRIGLADRLHHRPSELSGGQQQRIALARALAGRPEVIFADEPTGNLDTTASREMLTLLRDAVDQFDQTVVTVTHDPSIASYADRILHFSDGRVVDRADGRDAQRLLEGPRPDDGDDGGDGRHGQELPERRRSDGPQTMRSRRRRQPDEPAPGRPMVGSDDAVEVARQERWLRRIREQFEAEHAGSDPIAGDGGAEDGWAASGDTVQQPGDWAAHDDQPVALPAHASHDDGPDDTSGSGDLPIDHAHHQTTGDPAPGHAEHLTSDDPAFRTTDPSRDRFGTSAGTPDDARSGATGSPSDAPRWHPYDHEPHDGDPDRTPAPLHHEAADADGWLPRMSAPLYASSGSAAADDAGTQGWRDDTVARAEITPWSRPATELSDEQEPSEQHETSDRRTAGDPWAPADEHLAEEYRSERSNGRRGRGWQHDSGDIWSTGPWSLPAEAFHDEEVEQGGDAAETDDHEGDDRSTLEDMAAPIWQVDMGPDDPVLSRWHHDDVDASPGAVNGRHRNGQHRNGQHHNGQHHDDAAPAANGEVRDPWTNVWDSHAGPDLGEVWTPTFDQSGGGNGHVRDTAGTASEVPPSARRDPPEGGDDVGGDRGGDDDVVRERDDIVEERHGEADGIAGDDHHDRRDDGDDRSDDGDPPPDRPAEPASTADHDAPDAGGQPDAPHPHDDDSAPRPPDQPATPHPHDDDSAPRPPDHADASDPHDDRASEQGAERSQPSEAPSWVDHPVIPASTRPAHGPDAGIPPPLASLRNTRRPGESRNPTEALKSLQQQLDRLGGAGRRGGSQADRGGPRDTDRSGR